MALASAESNPEPSPEAKPDAVADPGADSDANNPAAPPVKRTGHNHYPTFHYETIDVSNVKISINN